MIFELALLDHNELLLNCYLLKICHIIYLTMTK